MIKKTILLSTIDCQLMSVFTNGELDGLKLTSQMAYDAAGHVTFRALCARRGAIPPYDGLYRLPLVIIFAAHETILIQMRQALQNMLSKLKLRVLAIQRICMSPPDNITDNEMFISNR